MVEPNACDSSMRNGGAGLEPARFGPARSGTVSQIPHLTHRRVGLTMGSTHGACSRHAPSGIRTRATTLKGWRPGPLVDGGGRSEDTRGRSYHPWPPGRLAQLVERLPYTQVAAGSSPAPPIRPLCSCGNGLKPWVSRARSLGTRESVRPPVRPPKSAERGVSTHQIGRTDLRRDSSVGRWPPWVTRGQTLGNKRLSLERYVGVGQRSSARSDTNLTRIREEPED